MSPRRPRFFENILESQPTESTGDFASQKAKAERLLQDVLVESVDVALIDLSSLCEPHSIYRGSLGVALLLYYARKLPVWESHSSWRSEENTLRRAKWLCDASLHSVGRSITFVMGEAGAQTVRALILNALIGLRTADSMSLERELDDALKRITAIGEITANLPSGECEPLYGRTGYLSCISTIRTELGLKNYCFEVAAKIVAQVLDAGLLEGSYLHQRQQQETVFQIGGANSPLMYYWHDTAYIGAAHGIIGILTVLHKFSQEVREHALAKGYDGNDLLLSQVEFILQHFSTSTGNIRSSVDSVSDSLVQWCHGAPGMLLLLASLLEDNSWIKLSPTARNSFEHYARRLAAVTWERGLLTKGYSLCHGLGGNGVALLYAGIVLKDQTLLHQALQFALKGALDWKKGDIKKQYHDYSLFDGNTGLPWLLMDLLRECAIFPGNMGQVPNWPL